MYQYAPQYPSPSQAWYRRWWGIIILLFLALFLISIFAFIFQVADLALRLHRGQIDNTGAAITNQQPVIKDNLDNSLSPYLGNPQAKIVIVEFGDFTCPFSKQAAPTMIQLTKLYPNQIKYVFRTFPIVSEESLPAAEGAYCAYEQGNLTFWAMHDRLFAIQNNMTVAGIKQIAADLGLNVNQFNNCLDSQKYDVKISNDAQTGQKAGAEKTPTFFVNGQMVEGVQTLENWRKAIDYLISQQQ